MNLFSKIIKTTTIATVTTVGVGAALSANAQDLSGFTATYTVKADGKSGSAIRTLTKNGNNYNYTVKAQAGGIASLSQSANFSLSNGKILPSNASMSVKVLGVGNTHSVQFNNNAKTVASTYKGKTTNLNMTTQAYDDLSLEAQIRQELINGKFSGTYHLVKKKAIETTKFKKSGNTTISVPAGTYEVIKIDRIHEDDNRATSFWLAPSLNYLPVKVSQVNDGKTISMELSKVN